MNYLHYLHYFDIAISLTWNDTIHYIWNNLITLKLYTTVFTTIYVEYRLFYKCFHFTCSLHSTVSTEKDYKLVNYSCLN